MPSPRVVKALDVIEQVRLGIIPRPVDLAGCAVGFQLREEAFHCSIVPDVTRPAYRTVWPASSPDSHDKGIGDELSRHLRLHSHPTTRRENMSTTAAT